jgi:hypothetical protein
MMNVLAFVALLASAPASSQPATLSGRYKLVLLVSPSCPVPNATETRIRKNSIGIRQVQLVLFVDPDSAGQLLRPSGLPSLPELADFAVQFEVAERKATGRFSGATSLGGNYIRFPEGATARGKVKASTAGRVQVLRGTFSGSFEADLMGVTPPHQCKAKDHEWSLEAIN